VRALTQALVTESSPPCNDHLNIALLFSKR